jgi:hypothetical protein
MWREISLTDQVLDDGCSRPFDASRSAPAPVKAQDLLAQRAASIDVRRVRRADVICWHNQFQWWSLH